MDFRQKYLFSESLKLSNGLCALGYECVQIE